MPVYRAFGVGSAAASVPSAPTKKYMTAEAVKKRYAGPSAQSAEGLHTVISERGEDEFCLPTLISCSVFRRL